MKIFFSYSMNDESRMRKVINELKSKGIVGKSDEIIYTSAIVDPGSSIRQEVRKAIERSSKVLVFWSDAGAESDWVNYETGMAEALGKPILFIVPKSEASVLPRELEHAQIVELENVNL